MWIAYWGAAFLLTHAPLGGLRGPGVPGADKIIHFCLYFGLAWLGVRATRPAQDGLRFRSAIGWALVFLVYGALDEWLQGFVGRTPSVYDWLADVAGIVVATIWQTARHPVPRGGRGIG